ncbi:MAG: TrkA C-terminal domain-containing protein [Nitrospirota bacterium]
MDLKEISLSSAESRFTIISKNGDKIEVVIYSDGKRGIEYYKRDAKAPASVVMDERDAQQVAAVIGGAFNDTKILEPGDIALKSLMLEWIRLEANVTVAGKSLGELRIREKTGVSIVAILRGENLLPSPKENKILLGRDYLLIIGKKDEIEKFKEMIGKAKKDELSSLL